jgi:hypothetical protein
LLSRNAIPAIGSPMMCRPDSRSSQLLVGFSAQTGVIMLWQTVIARAETKDLYSNLSELFGSGNHAR